MRDPNNSTDGIGSRGWVAMLAFSWAAIASAQARGTVWLQAEPADVAAGVDITVNGDNAGKLPVKLELPPGHYDIVARAVDGREWRQGIDIQGGETRTLQVNLAAPGAQPPPTAYAPPPRYQPPPPPPPTYPPPPPGYPPPPPRYPPAYGYYPPPRYVPPERLPFLALHAGFGAEYGGFLGLGVEGGLKWVTGFASLGWIPYDYYGNIAEELAGWEVGVRAMAGSRRFKGWASVSLGTVFTEVGTEYGVSAMVGARWFWGPYFFLHAGIGLSFPTIIVTPDLPASPVYFAFDLGGGFEFFGR